MSGIQDPRQWVKISLANVKVGIIHREMTIHKTFTYMRMSTGDVLETRGNLNVDLGWVVGPARSICAVGKQQYSSHIRDDNVPAHIVAIGILLAASELAKIFALERRVAADVKVPE